MMMTMNLLNLKKVYPAQDVPALSARKEEKVCGKGSGKLPLHRSETPSISGKKCLLSIRKRPVLAPTNKLH
jgi:hypothetical protein